MAKTRKPKPGRGQRKQQSVGKGKERGGKKASRPNPRGRTHTKPSWWDRLPLSRRHLAIGLFLTLIPVVYYAAINFGGMKLVGHDISQWRAMAQSVIEAREVTGESVLWATNPFGGMPAYLVSYPLEVPQLDTIVRKMNQLAWPTFQHVILLLGMYFFVFYLTKNTLAGLLSAVAYGFTSSLPIILSAGHTSKFIAFAYIPWVLLAFVHLLRQPGLRSGLLLSIADGAPTASTASSDFLRHGDSYGHLVDRCPGRGAPARRSQTIRTRDGMGRRGRTVGPCDVCAAVHVAAGVQGIHGPGRIRRCR